MMIPWDVICCGDTRWFYKLDYQKLLNDSGLHEMVLSPFRRFDGLYVSMVTDGAWTTHLKGDNTISCNPLSLSNFLKEL